MSVFAVMAQMSVMAVMAAIAIMAVMATFLDIFGLIQKIIVYCV